MQCLQGPISISDRKTRTAPGVGSNREANPASRFRVSVGGPSEGTGGRHGHALHGRWSMEEEVPLLIGGKDVSWNRDGDGSSICLESGLDGSDRRRHAELQSVCPRLPCGEHKRRRSVPWCDVGPFVLCVSQRMELPFIQSLRKMVEFFGQNNYTAIQTFESLALIEWCRRGGFW